MVCAKKFIITGNENNYYKRLLNGFPFNIVIMNFCPVQMKCSCTIHILHVYGNWYNTILTMLDA